MDRNTDFAMLEQVLHVVIIVVERDKKLVVALRQHCRAAF